MNATSGERTYTCSSNAECASFLAAGVDVQDLNENVDLALAQYELDLRRDLAPVQTINNATRFVNSTNQTLGGLRRRLNYEGHQHGDGSGYACKVSDGGKHKMIIGGDGTDGDPYVYTNIKIDFSNPSWPEEIRELFRIPITNDNMDADWYYTHYACSQPDAGHVHIAGQPCTYGWSNDPDTSDSSDDGSAPDNNSRRRKLRASDGSPLDIHDYMHKRKLAKLEGRRHLDEEMPLTFDADTEMLMCPEIVDAVVMEIGCRSSKALCFEQFVEDLGPTGAGAACSKFGRYGNWQGSADANTSSYAELDCPAQLLRSAITLVAEGSAFPEGTTRWDAFPFTRTNLTGKWDEFAAAWYPNALQNTASRLVANAGIEPANAVAYLASQGITTQAITNYMTPSRTPRQLRESESSDTVINDDDSSDAQKRELFGLSVVAPPPSRAYPPGTAPPSPPTFQRYARASSVVCEDQCGYRGWYNSDGDCDDGGRGAEYSSCDLGYDCTDCGSRTVMMMPPPPSPAPPPPPPTASPDASCDNACGDDGMTCGMLSQSRTCAELALMNDQTNNCDCSSCCSETLRDTFSYDEAEVVVLPTQDDLDDGSLVTSQLCPKSLWNAYEEVIKGESLDAFRDVATAMCDWSAAQGYVGVPLFFTRGRQVAFNPRGMSGIPSMPGPVMYRRELQAGVPAQQTIQEDWDDPDAALNQEDCVETFIETQAREALAEVLSAALYDDYEQGVEFNADMAVAEGVATIMDWFDACQDLCTRYDDGTVNYVSPPSPPPPSPPPPTPASPPVPRMTRTPAQARAAARQAARAAADAFRRAGRPRPRSWLTDYMWSRELQRIQNGWRSNWRSYL